MNKAILSEGLDYNDLEGQLIPLLTVDEYEAKMGENKDIVTLSFVIKSQAAGNDLVNWFERGYDWVLDASVSDGEIEYNRWLVFVELSRRSTVPSRIIELLTDLKTLTGLKLKDWTVEVAGEEHEADEDVLRSVIICNPNVYKVENEDEEGLNEMRAIAGLKSKPIYEIDSELKDFIAKAGL